MCTASHRIGKNHSFINYLFLKDNKETPLELSESRNARVKEICSPGKILWRVMHVFILKTTLKACSYQCSVDDKVYSLHKTHLATGINHSLFFRAQFTTQTVDLQKAETNLSHLPQVCLLVSGVSQCTGSQAVWEEVLTFLYTTDKSFPFSAEKAVPVMVLAGYLQIVNLFCMASKYV